LNHYGSPPPSTLRETEEEALKACMNSDGLGMKVVVSGHSP